MTELRRLLLITLALLMAIPPRLSAGVADPSPYCVRPGDELLIHFRIVGGLQSLNQLALSSPLTVVGRSVYAQNRVTVAPDGILVIPAVRMNVAGLTLEEIEKELTSRLDLEPGTHPVSVALATTSAVFYVWGEVKFPGKQSISRPTSLWEALSMAGGPTPSARLTDVRLIHDDGREDRFNISFKKDNPLTALKIPVNERDTVVVSQRRSANLYGLLLVLSVISTAAIVYAATKN